MLKFFDPIIKHVKTYIADSKTYKKEGKKVINVDAKELQPLKVLDYLAVASIRRDVTRRLLRL